MRTSLPEQNAKRIDDLVQDYHDIGQEKAYKKTHGRLHDRKYLSIFSIGKSSGGSLLTAS